MGSEVKGVYQLKGGIERYLQAFPEGGFWRGKNFVFDKREAIGAGNVNGDGGVVRADGKKGKVDGDETLLSWGTECAKCHRPWDRYIGKRKCYTCGVPILLCDACMSQSSMPSSGRGKKDKKGRKNDSRAKSETGEDSKKVEGSDKVRCPLCVEEGVTVPAADVEFTDNGVRNKELTAPSRAASGPGGDNNGALPNEPEREVKEERSKAAKSVLKWGGGHAAKKKEKRKFSRRLCQFGKECVRKDCFFYHPERELKS